MAKRNQNPSASDVAEGFAGDRKATDVRFKSYKNEGKGFDEFEEGQEIIGIFVSMRDHNITDQRTGEPKDIRVYSIRVAIPEEDRDADGPTEKVLKIGGRTVLDRLFDDIMDENGGVKVENRRYSGKGYEYLQNRAIRMLRGEDTKTRNKNPLGTYEVQVEE